MNKVLENYNRINSDDYFQNLIAQSYSRAVLRDVNEPPENYPKYDEDLDTKLIAIFQMYLNTALRVDFDEMDYELISIRNNSFKMAADILKNMYHYGTNKAEKDYYLLISSMAYYISGDYSKSFAIMKYFDEKNEITKMVAYYLKKEYNFLYEKVLFNINIQKSDFDSDIERDSHIYLGILSIAMNNYLRYISTGNDDFMYAAIENTADLVELCEIDNDVFAWYIFKLLNYLFKTFYRASLWKVVPPLIQDSEIVEKYILQNLFSSPSIVELFPFQIDALIKSMNPSGSVLALPTSSGKTKIAEINILKTLVEEPAAIILYLAPFKSLAFEVEETLKKNLSGLGIKISNMYGDGTESLFAEFLIGDSKVLIVTPEKAKMILRNDNDIKARLKLIILDEGHLIGGDIRFTRNELFYEELKYYVMKASGKFLVLSAILPNSSEVAKWITQADGNEYMLNKSINEKRYGVLLFKGSNVTIKWKGKNNPYNHNFVENINLPRKVVLPNDKRTAVILTALKFSDSGKVLIYLARKNMVKGYIQWYQRILDYIEDHTWENTFWEDYLFSLKAYYGEDSIYEKAALKGIIVHHASLPNDLRIATEKILRYSNPKIIVATSTLAQGVNIGVSTVIIAHYRMTRDVITNGEFNNIIGRAGRSFIDVEGKVLFAIDGTSGNSKWEIGIFESFINGTIERVESGVYDALKDVYDIALNNGIEFEMLLEIISNEERFEDDLNLFVIDDTLLAILNEENFELDSLDEFITNSFAMISAGKKAGDFDEEKLKRMIKARANYVKAAYQNSEKKELYLQSGIALSFIRLLEGKLPVLQDILMKEDFKDDLIFFLLDIANSELNMYRSDNRGIVFEQIAQWISGERLDERTFDNFNWSKFYYELPLIINTFSKICAYSKLEECNVKLLEFNELLKYGLPNLEAVKIYLMGLNSREVAVMISEKYHDLIKVYNDKLLLKLFLIESSVSVLDDFRDTEYFLLIQSWYENELLDKAVKDKSFSFRLKDIPNEIDEFRLIENEGSYYLLTLDLKIKYKLNLTAEDMIEKKFAINNLMYSLKRKDDDIFTLKICGD